MKILGPETARTTCLCVQDYFFENLNNFIIIYLCQILVTETGKVDCLYTQDWQPLYVLHLAIKILANSFLETVNIGQILIYHIIGLFSDRRARAIIC